MKHLGLHQPHVIIMVGIPGSGKTFFAEKFTETFHAPYIDYKKITTITNGDMTMGKTIMDYQLDELLKTNQSIVIECDTDTKASRLELAKHIRKAGYEPFLIWVQTDSTTAKARATKVSKRSTQPGVTNEEYERRVKHFTPPTPSEKHVVISGKHTYASQAKVVLQRLSAPRAEISTHSTPPTRLEQPGRRNITVR